MNFSLWQAQNIAKSEFENISVSQLKALVEHVEEEEKKYLDSQKVIDKWEEGYLESNDDDW